MSGEPSPQGLRDLCPQELGGWGPHPNNGPEPSKEQGEILQGVAEFCGQVVSDQVGWVQGQAPGGCTQGAWWCFVFSPFVKARGLVQTV